MQLEIRLSMDNGETILAYMKPFKHEDALIAGKAYDVGLAAIVAVVNDHSRNIEKCQG